MNFRAKLASLNPLNLKIWQKSQLAICLPKCQYSPTGEYQEKKQKVSLRITIKGYWISEVEAVNDTFCETLLWEGGKR